MRFNFFRDRLSIESLGFGMGSGFSSLKVQAPPTKAPATELEPGITGDAVELPTDGGKVSLAENISDLKPDTFVLNKTAFGLDGKSGNISIKDGNLAWGALGATPEA
jgi:hypothetical protein